MTPKGAWPRSRVLLLKQMDRYRVPQNVFLVGHNFGVDQHLCTKFGTQMENKHPKVIHWSEITFSKINPRWRTAAIFNFEFWSYFGVNQIFASQAIGMENKHKKSDTYRSIVRFSTIQHARHLEFDRVPTIKLSCGLRYCTELVLRWQKMRQ